MDLNLPRAPDREVLDEVIPKSIPLVVLTGSMDEELRRKIQQKPRVDYVVKRNAHEIEHVAYIIARLREN